jgi:hypothetical protein
MVSKIEEMGLLGVISRTPLICASNLG